MHFKALLLGMGISGFLLSEAMLTFAKAVPEARAADEANERVAEGPQEADARIGADCLGSLCGGGIGRVEEGLKEAEARIGADCLGSLCGGGLGRVEEGPQEAEARIGADCLGSLCGGGIGRVAEGH